MPHIIYALVDPRDQREFYVGRTEDVYRRFDQHLKCADKNGAKTNKILELKGLYLVPVLKTLEIIDDGASAALREAYWIKHFRTLGYPLTNDVMYTTLDGSNEDEDTPLVSITKRRSRGKETSAAKRVRRLVRKNPTISPTELAQKVQISRPYASKLKAQVLAEQSA